MPSNPPPSCGAVGQGDGISAEGDLATIHLASMPPEEARHARSVLIGEVLGEDWIPVEARLPVVKNDPVALAVNEEIAKMHNSYFEFDSHGQGCWFNEERGKADRRKDACPFCEASCPVG